MSTTTAQFFKGRNRKTVYLKEELDGDGNVIAVPCDEADPEAQPFEISRVNGDQIGRESMQTLLGWDEYVRFANWYTGHANQALTEAKTQAAKPTDASPWPDSPPEPSETYSAHMLALTKTLRHSILRAGMRSPSYAEVGSDLGPFEQPLHDLIRTFGRTLVTTDPKS